MHYRRNISWKLYNVHVVWHFTCVFGWPYLLPWTLQTNKVPFKNNIYNCCWKSSVFLEPPHCRFIMRIQRSPVYVRVFQSFVGDLSSCSWQRRTVVFFSLKKKKKRKKTHDFQIIIVTMSVYIEVGQADDKCTLAQNLRDEKALPRT